MTGPTRAPAHDRGLQPATGKQEARSWPRTWSELWLLAQVLVVLAAARLLPWARLQRLIRWVERQPLAGAPNAPMVHKAAQFTDALLRRSPLARRGPCLPRALTLFYFARRAGLPVELHCGVRRAGARLQGHAWLSLNGEPFLEKEDPRPSYAITFSAPPLRSCPASQPPATAPAGDRPREPA